MINTKCPECTARFYVSEELVTGKVVRFRCRKCGGTITVDGTKSTGGSDEEATDGADAALLSRLPPAPTPDDSDKVQIKEPEKRPGTLRPAAGLPPPAKGEQEFPRPPRPPSDVAAPEEGLKKPADVALSEKSDDWDEIDAPTDKLPKSEIKVDKDAGKPKDKKPPIAAKPVPVPKTAEPAKSAVAGKSQDGDEDPTALWQKNKDKKKEETSAPPASKPRLSRVSMDLGSVFDMPADEEAVDVPLEMDDEPAFEEELEPESMSSDELEPGSLSPESLKSLGAMPKPGAPPPPKIKPLPPKPKSKSLDRPSSARVDIRAALSRPAEVSDLRAPEELFAPVAIPADTLADLASPPDEEEKVEAAPVLSPALSPALVSAESVRTPDRSKEEGAPGSNRGMIIGAAVVGILLLAGVGYFATRGDEGPPTSQPVATATAEPIDQPANTSTAASPATGTAEEPAEPVKPPDEPTEPAATATAAALQPTGTATSSPTAAVPTAATATATATVTTTATPTATVQPTATATATATAEPTKAPPPKPPDTGEKQPFNKAAASSAIGGLKGAAQGCKQADGPQGHARVSITFAPSGRVTVATVTGPPFAGTPVGGCIAATFRRATIPPFSGTNVTVHTSVAIF